MIQKATQSHSSSRSQSTIHQHLKPFLPFQLPTASIKAPPSSSTGPESRWSSGDVSSMACAAAARRHPSKSPRTDCLWSNG